MKYYDGQEVIVGDSIVGGACGDCKVVEIKDQEIVAKNLWTGEVFDLFDYTHCCDLLSRKN